MQLNTLVLTYAGILLVSAFMSYFLWSTYRHPLLKELLLFWLNGILAFFAHGIFSDLDLMGFVALSLNWPTVIILNRILSFGTGIRLPFKQYNILFAISFLVGTLNLWLGGSFFTSSLVFCVVCFVVTIHGATARRLDPKFKDRIIYGYRFLLAVSSLHFLDYPFLRPIPQMAILGFSIGMIFFFSFAIYVPIFMLRKISIDHAKELENQVSIRTMQLTESQVQLSVAFQNLKAKNAQIESVFKANQTKLSSFVHDISNPLQVIGYHFGAVGDLLKDQADFRTRVQKIQIAISAIGQIVTDARASHSLDSNLQAGILTQVPLQQILEETIQLFQHKLDNKQIQLQLLTPGIGSLQIYGNSGWLKNQIFSNLISNAIKFTPQSGWIHISVHSHALNESKIILRIKDSGAGISPELRDQIFDLYQLTSTIGTAGEIGTGLGLPIVRQYLQLMGGKIKLLGDDIGPGACFELEFNKVV